jgi:hypothetical protein
MPVMRCLGCAFVCLGPTLYQLHHSNFTAITWRVREGGSSLLSSLSASYPRPGSTSEFFIR